MLLGASTLPDLHRTVLFHLLQVMYTQHSIPTSHVLNQQRRTQSKEVHLPPHYTAMSYLPHPVHLFSSTFPNHHQRSFPSPNIQSYYPLPSISTPHHPQTLLTPLHTVPSPATSIPHRPPPVSFYNLRRFQHTCLPWTSYLLYSLSATARK